LPSFCTTSAPMPLGAAAYRFSVCSARSANRMSHA
jgi:hypothetical protein